MESSKFDKNKIVEYKLSYSVEKSDLITELRKIRDTKNQYVKNVLHIDF